MLLNFSAALWSSLKLGDGCSKLRAFPSQAFCAEEHQKISILSVLKKKKKKKKVPLPSREGKSYAYFSTVIFLLYGQKWCRRSVSQWEVFTGKNSNHVFDLELVTSLRGKLHQDLK